MANWTPDQVQQIDAFEDLRDSDRRAAERGVPQADFECDEHGEVYCPECCGLRRRSA